MNSLGFGLDNHRRWRGDRILGVISSVQMLGRTKARRSAGRTRSALQIRTLNSLPVAQSL
jgi:hypothetical protein